MPLTYPTYYNTIRRRKQWAVPGFSPRSIAGLGLWYDASDLNTITHSLGAVSAWADKSGNSRTLSASAGTEPTTGTRTQNARNVLDFDGTDNSMVTAATFTYGASWTNFLVALNDDGADSTSQMMFTGEAFPTAYGRIVKLNTNVFRMRNGANLDRGVPDTSAHIYTVQYNGLSSLLRIDGTQQSTAGSAGTNSATVAFRIGADPDGPVSFWDGWIGEIIGYAAVLDATDIARVEGYLNRRWAIF